MFLNYIIYILNSKLGLTGKSKITEHKVINVIKEVKEIEVFVNKQKIETIQVYNDSYRKVGNLSNIIRTFNKRKSHLDITL